MKKPYDAQLEMCTNGFTVHIGCKKFVIANGDEDAKKKFIQYLFGTGEEVQALLKEFDDDPDAWCDAPQTEASEERISSDSPGRRVRR